MLTTGGWGKNVSKLQTCPFTFTNKNTVNTALYKAQKKFLAL